MARQILAPRLLVENNFADRFLADAIFGRPNPTLDFAESQLVNWFYQLAKGRPGVGQMSVGQIVFDEMTRRRNFFTFTSTSFCGCKFFFGSENLRWNSLNLLRSS
jgi:hypothetical protein